MKALTISEAINSENPSIGVMLMEGGENGAVTVQAILTLLIADIVSFLNVGKAMGQTQIAQTITLILNDVTTKNLKPDDFKVCFENAKKGVYGKVYDRIDGMIIFEWLWQYCGERQDLIETKQVIKHSETLAEEKRAKWSPEMIAILKSTIKPIEKEKKVKTLREKTEQEKLIQKFLGQFDKIWAKMPYKPKQGKFIKRFGKVFSPIEYTEYKLKQLQLIK